MKVLFVESPVSPFDIPTGTIALPEPLALETVAAGMTARHEVQILDLRLEEEQALRSTLRTFQPDVVAVGAVTANLHLAKDILRATKTFNPDIKTMIGGHHVTFKPQDAREWFVDVIIMGEGDYSAAEVVDAWESGKDLAEIKGLVVNQDGKQHRTGERALVNLDALPIPARHLVARYRSQYFQREYRPIVSINTSRGCPYKCDFCTLWKLNRGQYRRRCAEKVVEEIAGFEESFVDFIDDNSLDDFRRADKIASLMIEQGIKKKFRAYARADTIARRPKLISHLAEAGLKIVLVGLEAVDQKRLDQWTKSSDIAQNKKAIEILQENHIQIASYFLVDPNFTHNDFDMLWAYVERMRLSDPVFTVLVPFPGSELYARREHELHDADPRLFDFFHSVFKTRLPRDEFYERYAELYRKAYALNRQLSLVPKGVTPAMVEGKANRFLDSLKRIEQLGTHHTQPAVKTAQMI